MGRYLLRRVLLLIPIWLAVYTLTFGLMQLTPGGPWDREKPVPREVREALDRKYGLDKPVWQQYVDYLGGVVTRFDFGPSYSSRSRTVNEIIADFFPVSLSLGLMAMALGTVVGVSLGVVSALRHNTWLDYTIVGSALFLRTIPIFVLAPMLMILFVLQLGILDVPLGWQGLIDQRVILPIILLAAGPLADVVRQTRVAVLEVLNQDYVATARAKGLKTHMIVIRHVMRNALIPIVTSLGLIVNGLIHGSVFLDRVFSLPGFGSIVINSIQLLDFPVILGATIFSALLVIGANVVVDLIYPFIDPRVRLN